MKNIENCARLLNGWVFLAVGVLAACRTSVSPQISDELSPGYRSTAITVSAAEAKIVHPRDRIDILVTRPANKAELGGPRTAETILQNVLVYRVGALTNETGVVYVGLNPYEAQFAVLEDIAERFHITVRPRGDTEVRPMEKVEARKLFR